MQEEHSVSSEEPKFEVQQLRARVAQLEEIRGRHVRGSEETAEHIRTKVAKKRVGGCAEDVLPSTEQDLVCGWTTGRQNSGKHWMWQTSSQASSPGLSWPQLMWKTGGAGSAVRWLFLLFVTPGWACDPGSSGFACILQFVSDMFVN